MFRRRPRHLAYNRNMSFQNQLPNFNYYLPLGNNGAIQGLMNAIPYTGTMGGWNQGGSFQNPVNANPSFQEFPFNGSYLGMTYPANGMNMNGGGMPFPSMQQQMNMLPPSPFMNPYPAKNQPIKPQTSQVQSFMNQFKGQDGNVDMKKMMDTAGQMMNTVNQLNNMIKGIAATFKA